jgi:ABC-type phosphate/phosphonate transport system substrate-binding protein
VIAALQMYDWEEVRPRTDAFWVRVRDALRADGIDAPEALARPEDISVPWRDPDLLIGQTCGLPYVSGRCGRAMLVARPDYGLEHANAGTYQSALICHAEDDRNLAAFSGAHAAINDMGSQSGCNALADMIQRQKLDDGQPFFGQVTLSGSHRASARLIAEGKADIAAIDAVAWALFKELEPARHARLRVIGWSQEMPALPIITAPAHAPLGQTLFRALLQGCRLDTPKMIGMPTSFSPATDENYDPVRQMAKRVKGMRLATNAPPLS